MFYRKAVLENTRAEVCDFIKKKAPEAVVCRCSSNFRKFHREAPVLESLFNKVAGLRPATLLKRDS